MQPSSFLPQRAHPALYVAFDVHPSAKGASTHITHFSECLFEYLRGGLLYVVGHDKLPAHEAQEQSETLRFAEAIPNYLERAQAFSERLLALLPTQPTLRIAHFRDIWGGLPLLQYPQRTYRCLFEVNGLPSIELPYRYPLLSSATLKKFEAMEQFCLEQADHLVVPSAVIARHLESRGIAPEKITLISNGAELPHTLERPAEAPAQYIVYFGALQSWQGVDVLLKAFRIIAERYPALQLVICASTKSRHSKDYLKFARNLGLEERVQWLYQLKKRDLYAWVHHALFSVAPLKACSRNIVQGCSPLKILESMALGTPVLASDLPAVREIIWNNHLGLLFRPDRPAELARAMRLWIEQQAQWEALRPQVRSHIEKHYSWADKKAALIKVYEGLLSL
jgi:glycosyltransferase involved in cell wall biosynthesis